MRIILAGVETNNKGAELMLYAILQEIERKFPKAIVYMINDIRQGRNYIESSIDLRPNPWISFVKSCPISFCRKALKKLHISDRWFEKDVHAYPFADYYLDASGFAISDVWNETNEHANQFEKRIKNYSRLGTKIVFLPQAFGPIELQSTKKMMESLGRYANFITARDETSLSYINSFNIPTQKIKLYPDFTSLVRGRIPESYKHLEGGICIIPNVRMIDMGTVSIDDYFKILSSIIAKARFAGKFVYLLNHEGKPDEDLCYEFKKHYGNEIEIVTGLNALEVKGIISTAYLVVSSRFHGVVSSLNCGVPCLSTSWSHKYAELYKDYGLDSLVLPLDNEEKANRIVVKYLDENVNKVTRQHLLEKVEVLKNQTVKMWNEIWTL